MRTYPLIPCPYCQKSFQPRRKNQQYCSTECRTDSNNEAAKQRYTTFKVDAPKLKTLVAQVRELQTKLTSARILIKDVEEIDEKTIRYDGRRYKQVVRVGRMPDVILFEGLGVLTGDTIVYRRKQARSSDAVYRYELAE